jgi:hypothetical protein
VSEAPTRGVALPPNVKELAFGLDVPQAVVIACEPASRDAVGIEKVQLRCDAVEVPSEKKLTVVWKAG